MAALDDVARRIRVEVEQLRSVARVYGETGCIYTTASRVGLGWPAVHSAIFDLRRAGVLPRREKARA